MNATITTNLGNVMIENDVIAKYAGSAAVECFGVVGMAAISMKDGKARVDATLCVGCGVCQQLCPFDAIN